MASGLIGNEVPRQGLRVRLPCPPLPEPLPPSFRAAMVAPWTDLIHGIRWHASNDAETTEVETRSCRGGRGGDDSAFELTKPNHWSHVPACPSESVS